MRSGGASRPQGVAAPGLPWQFGLRAALVISGLTLLLIVNVRGAVFYIAWTLIVLALISEGAATVAHWHRARGSR